MSARQVLIGYLADQPTFAQDLVPAGDKAWKAVIEAQLEYHREYLVTASFRPDYYSDELRALLPQKLGAARNEGQLK
jgi:hypothetical protein